MLLDLDHFAADRINLLSTKMALEDYIVLPVTIPNEYGDDVIHHLYIRPNTPKFPLVDDQRTLFVSNLPVDTDDAHLKALFSALGARTEHIQYHIAQDSSRYLDLEEISILDEVTDEELTKEIKRLREVAKLPSTWSRNLIPSGSNAHIRFVEPSELQAVIKNAKLEPTLVWGDGVPDNKASLLGADRYKDHLRSRIPDAKLLQESVDAYMELFNEEEVQKKRKQKLIRTVPDEDGFITITRSGKSGAGHAADMLKLAEASKTRGIYNDLYRFQRKAAQAAKMSDLRVRFEEDKKKIQKLKSRRVFQG